jgi:hypothetical protein
MADLEKNNADNQTEHLKKASDQSAETDREPVSEATGVEDAKTSKAVDDIMKNDGDEVLKVQDEAAEKAVVMKSSKWESFKNKWVGFWANPRKRWTAIGVLVVVVGALFAVPYTRYNILGLVLKSTITVQAVDSKTGAPVSGAVVELSGKKAETQANGKATLKVTMGTGSLQVSKKYYTGYKHNELVTAGANNFKATLIATGRQIHVKLVNKVTAKPISGAKVSAAGANTKTDAKGMATIVIPSGVATQAANITADGFNAAKVDLVATDDLAKDTFTVTPAGKLYFLSNLNGTIDVAKANLDGSDRQTVLAGTGSEDRNSTSLLASRDWKYLALLSKRAGEKASIYLIDTTNGDKLSTIDEGNADFTLVGWSNDRFVYQVSRNTVSDWQSNKYALKSFDPTTGRSLLLDQTQASGSGQNDYVGQYFGSPYLIDDQVVYAKGWSGFGNSPVSGKQGEVDTIGADGSGHKVVKTFAGPSSGTGYGYQTISISTVLYEPGGFYISVGNTGENPTFYDYEDGKISGDTEMTEDKFFTTPYPTFLVSPSSNATFWADQRDGKNTLFIGDKSAKNQKQVASLSAYNTYGWFTDDYLLVSKNSSELYIMGKDGGGTPLKITDYYKPAVTYNGYGGGYGGR